MSVLQWSCDDISFVSLSILSSTAPELPLGRLFTKHLQVPPCGSPVYPQRVTMHPSTPATRIGPPVINGMRTTRSRSAPSTSCWSTAGAPGPCGSSSDQAVVRGKEVISATGTLSAARLLSRPGLDTLATCPPISHLQCDEVLSAQVLVAGISAALAKCCGQVSRV
jgi:hypothetical protein